jgi:5-oxoprolinase (ATP-hydrolysing) subunit C
MPGFLRAVAPTPFVTVQDRGRQGWRRFGVSGSGAMDPDQLAIANVLVGNPPQQAALEFAFAGGDWEVCAGQCRVAVAGGGFRVAIDGVPMPAFASTTLRRGQYIAIGAAADAVWGYLAVAGGFALPRQLGSLSTHVRSGVGGLDGRTVQAGDEVPLAAERVAGRGERRILPPARSTEPIGLVLGPQLDRFTTEAVASLLGTEWRIGRHSDRMAYRLEGPPLAHRAGHDIVSDGTVPGSIQVPGDGTPLVLMRDCQTTGGYPKIATVITADLPRLAQLRAGAALRFRALAVEEAQRQTALQATRLQRVLRTIPHLGEGFRPTASAARIGFALPRFAGGRA